jgi:Na+-transporting NADH:ubiquinone oxidoreductase subunit B
MSGPPYVRGFWTVDRIILAQLVALLPPLAEAIYRGGVPWLTQLLVALLVAVGWSLPFARWRAQPLRASGVVAAVAASILLPPGVPRWQVVLAVSFGVVIGEQIFGGYGWNFLHPATLALAFLMFSYPAGGYDQGGLAGWAVCVPGALLLASTGIVAWQILVAAPVAALTASWLVAGSGWPDRALIDCGAFGLVFLGCDPVAAPATHGGRWAYGALLGGMVVRAGSHTSGPADNVVFACLVASIFAPLIDQGVIWLNVKRRRRRHGPA